MSLKKQLLKSQRICRVTFKLPKEAVNSARKVNLVGEFNNWNTLATPMKRQKNGAFSISLDLERGKEYQFRYLIDEETWENDWEADKYIPTPFGGSENSVLVL